MANRYLSSSPLLDKLPPELRNQIYILALTTDGPMNLSSNGIKTRIALLQACKQIRNEALPILFAMNSFTVTFRVCGPGLWKRAIGRLQNIDPDAARVMNIRVEIVVPDAVRIQIDSMRRRRDIWRQLDYQEFYHQQLNGPLASFTNDLALWRNIESKPIAVADPPPFPELKPGEDLASYKFFWSLVEEMHKNCKFFVGSDTQHRCMRNGCLAMRWRGCGAQRDRGDPISDTAAMIMI